MAGAGITARVGPFVALSIAQPVRFRIEQRVQRLLDRAANDPAQMSLDPFVVDPDHVVERSRCRQPSSIVSVRHLVAPVQVAEGQDTHHRSPSWPDSIHASSFERPV